MAVSNKWMRDHDIYDQDIESLLQEYNIQSESDLATLKTKDWNAIWNQCVVERAKTSSQQSTQRLEKKMKKLEKLWRKRSGIKLANAVNTPTGPSHLNFTSASAQVYELASNEAPLLKKWLKERGIWLKDLFEALVRRDINSPDEFFLILDSTMEEIKREVRVVRAKDTKSTEARKRLENTLKKFEDEWRKLENKPKKKKKIYDDQKSAPTPTQTMKQAEQEELAEKGKLLKDWMRSQGIWQLALYEELLNVNVTSPADLALLKPKECNAVIRKVKVVRFSTLKNQNSRVMAEKLLVKFEKLYKKNLKKQQK
eukprot:631395_1